MIILTRVIFGIVIFGMVIFELLFLGWLFLELRFWNELISIYIFVMVNFSKGFVTHC